MENYDEAIKYYKKALKIDPNRATTYINLGMTYNESKRIE